MSDTTSMPPAERSSLHDGVAAYALNSLSTIDRYAFEAHLAECADCRREYARYEAVATFLPEILARIDDGRTRHPSDRSVKPGERPANRDIDVNSDPEPS